MSSHPIDLSAGIVGGGTTPSIDLSAGVVHDLNPIDLSAGVVSEARSPAPTVAPQPSRWDRFKTTLENALEELHEGLTNESAMMQAVGRGAPLANPVAVASPEAPVRATVGATQLTTPGKRVEGAANLLEGTLGTAQPLLYAGAIESPMALAEGLADGFAGQKATESAAKAVGASPGVARLAGDVGGVIAGAGGGRKAIEEMRSTTAKPISDEAAHARYEQMPETAGGRMVSADLYKKALIDKAADTVEGRIEQNNAVHERSSDLARQRFVNALDRPQEGRPGVTIVAGAPGAGKSLALSGGIGEDQRAVYEGTFSNFDKTRDLLQAAIDSGHKPTFVLVHADPDVLADRIVERAKTEGRLPPVSYVASKALEVPETARKLVEHFGDKVNWKLTDNSEPARPHAEYEGADAFKSQLDAVRYTGSKDELAERIRERYATGRQSVSADGASAGPGGAQEVAAGAVPAPVSGDAGNGDAGGAGGIAGPGRRRDPGTPQTAVKSPPAEIPPPRPYQYHPIDASQPLRGIFYHGTKAQVSSAHELNPEVYADPGGTAGIGLYLTDNPEVAAGYSRTRGRGAAGQVLPVQVNGAKLLDLEAPASELLRATLKKDFGNQYEDLGPEATGQDLIARIHENLASEGISKSDAIENFQDLAIDLKQQGIDGFLQKGGQQVGKQYGAHNVAVLFPDFQEGTPLSHLIADVEPTPTPTPVPAAPIAGNEAEPSNGHDSGGNLASGSDVPQAASERVVRNSAAGPAAEVNQPSGPLARVISVIQKLRAVPEWATYKSVAGPFLRDLQKSGLETSQEVQAMRKTVPKLARRQAIFRWIEAEGNPDIIRQRIAEAASKGNQASVQQHTAALNLSPNELDLANTFKQRMQELLELGQRVGALGEGVENYVPHLWEKLPAPGDGQMTRVGYEGQSGILNTNLAAAKRRVFGSLHEGEMMGKVPQTTDLAQVYGLYRRSLEKAIAGREFVAALRSTYGSDGRPLVMYPGVGRPLGEPEYALTMAEDKYDPGTLQAIRTAMQTPEDPGSQEMLARAERGGLIEKEGTGMIVRPRVLPSTKLIAADLQRLGNERLENAVAAGHILKEDGPNGSPVYRWTTEGYKGIESRALQKMKWLGQDASGKPILLESSAVVHPEIYDDLKNLLAPESPFRKNAVLKQAMRASSGAKQTLLSLSSFHIIQEGLRGVQSGVNSPQLFLDALLKRNPIDTSDPELLKLMEHGLLLHDINGREDYAEGLAAHGGLASKIPGIGHVNNAIGDTLFHEFIPRLKAASALADIDRFRKAYPNLNDDQIYQLAAEKANATFGGLNYKLMGRSAATQDLFRAAALAPDWLESNLRTALAPFTKYGAPYRADLARIAAYTFAVSRVLNLLNTGQLHLEHPLGVVSHDGKHVWQVRTMPSDIAHMLTDPRSFIWNRLNPMVTRVGMEAMTGRDQWGHERSGRQQIEDIGRNVLPIPVQGLPGLRTSPEETNAEAVGRAMGFTELPNRTDAEKLAMQFGSAKMPSGIISDAQRAHSATIRQLVDGMRNGTLNRDAVVAQVQQGKISPVDGGRVIEESRVSPLAWQVSRLGVDQALQVYQAGTPQEKQELRPIVESKVMHWRRSAWKTMTPTELHQTMQKIVAVLGSH